MRNAAIIVTALCCIFVTASICPADDPDGNGRPEAPPAIENASGVAPVVLEFIAANDPPYGPELADVIKEYLESQGLQSGLGQGQPPDVPPGPPADTLGALVRQYIDEGNTGQDLAGLIHEYLGIEPGQDGALSGASVASLSATALNSPGAGSTVVPEPATMALLAVGGLAMLKRKRKS